MLSDSATVTESVTPTLPATLTNDKVSGVDELFCTTKPYFLRDGLFSGAADPLGRLISCLTFWSDARPLFSPFLSIAPEPLHLRRLNSATNWLAYRYMHWVHHVR